MMKDFSLTDIIYFQCRLIEYQMETEKYFMDIARMCKVPTVVICDRGVVDPRAYVSEEIYQSMLDIKGWNRCHLRDSHYDAVIFMDTAAYGAE